MAKDHGNQIKNDDTYEALRDEGYSKENRRALPMRKPANKPLLKMVEKAKVRGSH